jgi:autotransporter-associated beta strand protein
VGAVTISSGTIQDGSLTSGTTYQAAGGTISANLGGSAGLVMNGSTGSILTLGGTNTYSGGTTVSGGTVTLAGASELPSAGVLTVGSNQAVDLTSLLSGGGSLGGPMEWAGTPAPAPAVLSEIQSGPALVPNMATLGGAPALSQDGAGSAVGGITAGSAASPAQVPEPGTFVLTLAAIISLGLFQVRRRIRG